MWQPDMATVRMMLGVGTLLSLLVTLGLWRVERGRAGTGPWLLAALLGLGAGLLPPAVNWRLPDLGVVTNTSLTLAAMVLTLEGILCLRGWGDRDHRRRRLVMMMGILAIIALMLAAAGRPWLRIVLHDALAALLLGACATMLAWKAAPGQRTVSTMVAAAFGLFGLLYAWRGTELLGQGMVLGGADTRMPPWLLLASLVWLLIWTASMPLLLLLRAHGRERSLIDRDGLTGLSSRAAFLRDGAAALYRLRGQEGQDQGRTQGVGVLLLSLEGLRLLNETLGHATGDRMLVAVADRLRQGTLPAGALTGRLTGAQVAILLPELKDRAELLRISQELRQALTPPLALGSVMQQAGYSLGAALYPDDGSTIAALLQSAERAMFKVRAAGTA